MGQDATPHAGAQPPQEATPGGLGPTHTHPGPPLRPTAPGSAKQPGLPRTEKNHQQQIFYFQLPAESVPVVLASWAAAAPARGSLLGGHGRGGDPRGCAVSPHTPHNHPGTAGWHRGLCTVPTHPRGDGGGSWHRARGRRAQGQRPASRPLLIWPRAAAGSGERFSCSRSLPRRAAPRVAACSRPGERCQPRHRGTGAARTCDHLLGVVGLHVAVVLPQALGLPLPLGALGVVGVGVVLQDDDLGKGRAPPASGGCRGSHRGWWNGRGGWRG